MDKLISQQAAINVVSEITTTMSVCTNKDECYGMKRMQKQAITELANLPSAKPEPSQVARDIVTILENEKDMRVIAAQSEIVRCKDCKYVTEHYDTDGNVPYWTCSEWDSGTDCDGFCHYAERREK